MAAFRELPRERRGDDEALERPSEAGPLPLAQSVLALQHTAGNAAVQRMLSLTQPEANVLARAPHRPKQGAQIKYKNAIWNVLMSDQKKPTIKIQQTTGKKQQDEIEWRKGGFWIIRANTEGDYDMRDEKKLPADADAVRKRFDEAKAKALSMLKAYAGKYVQQASQRALKELTLDSFDVEQTNTNTEGEDEACEWTLEWKEVGKDADRPRRIWYFKVDVDDPPETSDQEPHVGWDARAEGGDGKNDVERLTGHIWLDAVPVGRGEMVHV